MTLKRTARKLVNAVMLNEDRDDDDGEYVCVHCAAEYDRNYAECPECGKPYVTAKE